MKDAAPAQNQGEQDTSMEEILQSIRKIIAEEGDAPAQDALPPDAPAAKTEEKPAAKADAKPAAKDPSQLGSDILELTDMLTEDGSVVNIKSGEQAAAPPKPAPAAAKPASPGDVLSNIDQALAGSAPPPSAPPPAKDALLSDAAAAASAEALKKLPKEKPQPAAPIPSPTFRSGTTVEDLVKEALRPMLKEWLDSNLPKIVERIVEKEVAKLSRPE